MVGYITLRHVMAHCGIIVSEWGWLTLARCVMATILRQNVTFLSLLP